MPTWKIPSHGRPRACYHWRSESSSFGRSLARCSGLVALTTLVPCSKAESNPAAMIVPGSVIVLSFSSSSPSEGVGSVSVSSRTVSVF
eukprot:jgi/Picre1/28141/NNA_003547.t1